MLESFSMATKTEKPGVHKQALKSLIPFPSSYLCKSVIAELVYVENKYTNRMSIERDLRLKVTSVEPDINSLVQNKQ